MKINIKKGEKEYYIQNIAFIKAILIRETIENLNISYEEKVEIKNKILEYLKNN